MQAADEAEQEMEARVAALEERVRAVTVDDETLSALQTAFEKGGEGAALPYAVALSKREGVSDRALGREILCSLLEDGERREDVPETLLYLVLALYREGDYERARTYCEELLRIRPSHADARNLLACVRFCQAKQQDQTQQNLGMAIGVGAVVSVAALALAAVLRKR